MLRLVWGGGGGPVPVPPYLAWGCAPPVGWVCASGAFLCQGVGWGGGGGAARAPRPPFVRPGGPVGRGVALPCSVPLPSLGRQQSGCHWHRSGDGGRGPHTAPVCARLPSLGMVCAASWRIGAGSLAPRGSRGSRRLGRGGGPCSGPSHGRRGPAGGRGDHPLCPGGLGAGAAAACGPARGLGGGGGLRRGPPDPPLGSGPRFPTLPLLSSSAHSPPACAFGRGRGAAPCTGCGLPGEGGGGEEGRPVDRSPGGPSRPEPSLCPPRVGNFAGCTMLWSWGARPPYCSGAPPRAAPGLGPRAAPARWCGLAYRPQPPREQAAGGARARGVLVQLRPPPPPPRVAVPSGGGGASLRLRGLALLQPLSWGGSGAGGGGGRAAPPPPAPPPRRASACHPSPRGISVLWALPGGRKRRVRAGRPPTGLCGGGGGGGGGGECRSVAGRAGA